MRSRGAFNPQTKNVSIMENLHYKPLRFGDQHFGVT